MGKKRVPLHQNPRGFVDVDPDATPGAQVGVNLLGPDGRVLTAAQVINPVDSGGSRGPSGIGSTIWKFIREIPLNIQKLAELFGRGFAIRRDDGEWALRTLQAGDGIDITNADGAAGDPSIALTGEAIASLAKADSAVQEVRPGAGVTVDNADPRRPIVSATGGAGGSGILPVVTGEIVSGQPVFLIADDGNLIYTEIL